MKHGTKLQQSIIDKRNAETRLINAKAVLLEMECDSKEDEITSLYTSYAKLEKELNESNIRIHELNCLVSSKNDEITLLNAADKVKYKELEFERNSINDKAYEFESELKNFKEKYQMDILFKDIEINSRKDDIRLIQRKLRNNRFWFITIAGILSGIALFMFLTLLQWTN